MFYALWIVAILRLLIPIAIPSPTSVFNLLPSSNWMINSMVENAAERPLTLGQPVVPAAITAHDFRFAGTDMRSEVNLQASEIVSANTSVWDALLMEPLTLIWLTGFTLLGIAFITIYIKHLKDFANSTPAKGDYIEDWLEAHNLIRKIRICETSKIATPLTYGVLRPVILLPKGADWSNTGELEYILAHEFMHIKRFDALTKLVATVVLCIHWFNPLVWVMYFMLNRDMETSCDEAVLNMFGRRSKKSYALTLVGMVQSESRIPALYNNFSKHAIEERINVIMKMKNITLVRAMTTFALVGVTTAIFATNGVEVQTATPRHTIEIPQVGPLNPDAIDMPMLTMGDPFADPSDVAISREEATLIGLTALAEFFDGDLDNLADYVVHVFYSPSFNPWRSIAEDNERIVQWTPEVGSGFRQPSPYSIQRMEDIPDYRFPMNVYKSLWSGTVSLPTGEPSPGGMRPFQHEFFRFSVDTETGELVSAQYFPRYEEPTRRIGAQYSENMGSAYAVWEYIESMTEQHNIEYSNFAMQVAQEIGLFEGEILRAALISGSWMAGRNSSFELAIHVLVECVDGEKVILGFQGRNRKELVGIEFFDRRVDYAVNRDGSTTEPRSRFAEEDLNWIYR